MSWPSIRMRPASRSYSRSSTLTSVDLPAPDGRPGRCFRPAAPPGRARRSPRPACRSGNGCPRSATSPRVDDATARASARSTTVRGCATVVMPSCTVPMSSKMPLTTHMIQPDMLLMRITRPVDSAMSPTVIEPRLHSHRPSAEVPTISKPLSVVMLTSIAVVMRVISAHLVGVLGDGFADVGVLAVRVREQFQRGDVGVAVDHPAHEARFRLRGLPRALLHPRHEERQQRRRSRTATATSGSISRQSAFANSTSAVPV